MSPVMRVSVLYSVLLLFFLIGQFQKGNCSFECFFILEYLTSKGRCLGGLSKDHSFFGVECGCHCVGI